MIIHLIICLFDCNDYKIILNKFEVKKIVKPFNLKRLDKICHN